MAKAATKTETTGMKVTGIPVKSAYLHQAVSWPGHPAERTISQAKYPGVSIYLVSKPDGLLLEHKEDQHFVPSTNVAGCSFSVKLDIG